MQTQKTKVKTTMNSKTKPVETSKAKTEERNKPTVAKRLGTFLLMGALMTGAGAKLGCGDDGGAATDAGNSCYTQVDADSGVNKCLSRDETKCDWVMMEVDSGATSADAGATAPERQKVCAPVSGVVSDAGVVSDSTVEAPVCEENNVASAEINMSHNVKINGVECGQESCNGVVSVGETLEMDGAKYKVTAVDDKTLVAESGEYLLVATMGDEGACIVKKNGVEQGSCMNTLKASVVPVTWSMDDLNELGKTTLSLSTNSSFTPGAETKMTTVTEVTGNDGSKTVTLGPYVTVNVSAVKSLEGKTYVSVKVTNSDTSNKCSEPMGLALDEGNSKELCGVHVENESSSELNASCTDVRVTLNVEGEGNKTYKDGETAKINGQNFKVVLQPKMGADGSLDWGRTYVNLENLTADKNKDNVLTNGEASMINGTIVTVVEITSSAETAQDAGVSQPKFMQLDIGL